MIRSEPIASIIRFYEAQTDDPFADYSATCTVVWEASDVVWIKALSGKITRKQIIELAEWLISQGVTLVKASRAHGKRLPFSADRGHYQEIDLQYFTERLARSQK